MPVLDLSHKAVIVVQYFSKQFLPTAPGFCKTNPESFSSWHFTWKLKKIYLSGIQSFQHTVNLPAALHSKLEQTRDTLRQNSLSKGLLKTWSSKTRWPYSQKSDIEFDLINFYLVLWNLMTPIDFQVYNSTPLIPPIISIKYWLIMLHGFITVETDSYD